MESVREEPGKKREHRKKDSARSLVRKEKEKGHTEEVERIKHIEPKVQKRGKSETAPKVKQTLGSRRKLAEPWGAKQRRNRENHRGGQKKK